MITDAIVFICGLILIILTVRAGFKVENTYYDIFIILIAYVCWGYVFCILEKLRKILNYIKIEKEE